jgi:type IV pilus assembly protein PilW
MRKPLHSRGFTLLELLVGAAVGALVLIGISITFISQARQYQAHVNRRALQSNARQAMSFMERRLRNAGYGVDPDRAILAYDSFNAAANATEPGFPDAFVVHWRDPLFRREAVDANATEIVLPGPINTPLRMGQILLVLCSPVPVAASINDTLVNANTPHAFVTVGAFVDVNADRIPLDQTAPAGAPNSPLGMAGRLFHEQGTGLTNACFRNPTTRPVVVMVNRAAFYIAMFDDGQGALTPYLMMHNGLDMPTDTQPNGDGTINALDAVPVAAGIEQLQVAYILDTNAEDTPTSSFPGDNLPIIRGVEDDMPPATYYGENWEAIPINHPVTGNLLPRGWAFNPLINPNSPFPLFRDAKTIARARLLDHPANIRQVRLTLISRSPVVDPQLPGDNLMRRPDGTPFLDGPALGGATGRAWRHLENLGPTPNAQFRPSTAGYYRFILRQSVAPKNMLMSRQFVPVTPGGG